jgi:hypothetical protein
MYQRMIGFSLKLPLWEFWWISRYWFAVSAETSVILISIIPSVLYDDLSITNGRVSAIEADLKQSHSKYTTHMQDINKEL